MKYEIDIKATIGDTVNYYAKSLTQTSGDQPVYLGCVTNRAFWFDTDGGQWWNTPFDEVGDTTEGAGKYTSSTLYGTYADVDLSELVASQYVIADAWYRAESTAFESLREYVGCEEERDCFRGYMPITGDATDYKYVNVWSFSSGGSGEYDAGRLSGESALWCSLRSDATIVGLFETRERAMKFSGLVMAWLKETDNLMETDNVEQCRLTDIPDEPEIYYTSGKIRKQYWRQTIELELIYRTENVFD